MSKWKATIAAVALLVVAAHTVATAQMRTPEPTPSHGSRQPITQSDPARRPETNQLVKRQAPHSDLPVVKAAIKVYPIEMYNLASKPFMAETDEGQLLYLYGDHERLIEEHIGTGDDMVIGQYTYGADGRFERLDYSDGIIITAEYGKEGELLRLTSGSGRAIGFRYPVNEEGEISIITPTQNFVQFHSAVALLRQARLPYWWPASAPAMEHLTEKEGKGGKATPSGNGWDEGNEYPYDPFPGTPKTPDGTSEIEVKAPRLPPSKLPPPFIEPVYRDGIEIIPTGGPGGRSPTPKSGGIIAGELEGLEDFDSKLVKKERCHAFCGGLARQIGARCRTGPTVSDRDDCWNKRESFQYHCATACDTGDYQLEFFKSMPPEQRNFAPWEPSWKIRL